MQAPASTDPEPTAQLLLHRDGTAKTIRVSFQVLIEATTDAAEQLITVIPLKTSAGEVNATLGVIGTQFIFRFDGPHPLGPAPLNTWTLVEQAIAVDGGAIEIKINGQRVYQGLLGTLTPTEAAIDFGLYRGGASEMKPTRFRLDDFALDVELQ